MHIVGQQWGHLAASSGAQPVSVAQTILLSNRDISAGVAVSSAIESSTGVGHAAHAQITHIVSDAGAEQPMLSVIGRSGTTSITLTLLVFNGSAIARWLINHWE